MTNVSTKREINNEELRQMADLFGSNANMFLNETENKVVARPLGSGCREEGGIDGV